jgi:hypothetical protein
MTFDRSLVVLAGACIVSVGLGGRGLARDRAPRTTSDVPSVAPSDSSWPRPRFLLMATQRARPASGWVMLAPAPSPFGIAASDDGRITYDLDISVSDLPEPSTFGPYSIYVAWLTTPKLDVVRNLGAITDKTSVHAEVDWNKFTVLVSAESAPNHARWSDAIVLVGRSPSSLMQSFAGHPFYKTGEAPY